MSLYIIAPLVISLLVIIHEFGHYLVARAFGMRVLTYSIGFGPVIAKWKPRGSETTFQIAAIPVLAYVQIAGMNPREVTDANDRGSYQNASPIARFLTIAAGPMANYLAAALLFFALIAIGGEPVTVPQVGRVSDGSPAAAAGLRADDTIRAINGTPIPSWETLIETVRGSNGRPLNVVLDRHGERVVATVTPRMSSEHRYIMGVEVKQSTGAPTTYHPVSIGRALETGIIAPANATMLIMNQIGGMLRRTVPVKLVGPVGIVAETVNQAKTGWRNGLEWIGLISLQLFIFNLLPIPALDGGRLLVLGYEMVTRRRPNPKIEAQVLTASLMLMIGLFLVVTSREVWGLISGLFRG